MLRSALAVAGIALVPLVATGQQTGRDDSSFLWSKQLAAGTTVGIRSANGAIDVRESPNDRVEVRAVKHPHGRSSIQDVSFDVRESSGEALICVVYEGASACDNRNNNGGYRRNINVEVEFTVLIPRSMRLRLMTGNGAISIDKAGADVVATTGNGRVTVGETTGRVEVTSGNGDVQVESANGPVNVSTGNGRVFVATSSGAVSASSGNGEVNVRIQQLTAPSGMSFSTGSGSIRVTLPADYNGAIDASTGNGSLHSDFEIKIVGRINPQHLRGTIGQGGPTLRLNTGNGNVELRKAR